MAKLSPTRKAGHRDRLASKRISTLLEVEKSWPRIGRPGVPKEIRELIRSMSSSNILWGASRIHAELLKLGIEVSQGTAAKYMLKHRKPPSQTWRTFLENHVKQLVSVDFFVVPTLTFRILYVFLVLAHDRRRIVHFNVTDGRPVQPPEMGKIIAIPKVGGLHHQYERCAA